VLSATKFALVAMFYMHLRYDARLFSGLFVGGLALALTVFLAVLSLFTFLV
jgi:cytochrome c oxidase subunit 4